MAYQNKISEVQNTLGAIGKCETAGNIQKTVSQKPIKNSMHN